LGTHVERFAPEVLPALLSYQWPGNVRELENVIKASLVVARGNVFQLEFLPERIRQVPRQEPGGLPPAGRPSEPAAEGQSIAAACRRLLSLKQFHGQIYQQVMESAQREVIRACLEETRGQLAPAARLLGITRTTLRKKMAELGIRVSAQVDTQVTSDQGG
jgi:two-component system nitrogen regulation response regulator GlnG